MMTKCNQCGRKIPDDFQHKWNHVVTYHPEILAARLLPLIEDPMEAHRFGEALGGWIKSKALPS
jgi:hypothetical protein